MAEHSIEQSKPFITTATMNTFQIRRGRKPTLITKGHGRKFDPIIEEHKHDAKHFLLKLHPPIKFKTNASIFVSVTGKAWIGRSRPSTLSPSPARPYYTACIIPTDGIFVCTTPATHRLQTAAQPRTNHRPAMKAATDAWII
ncbi:hypothetical protein ACLOJK_019615 [Asimina triloba]